MNSCFQEVYFTFHIICRHQLTSLEFTLAVYSDTELNEYSVLLQSLCFVCLQLSCFLWLLPQLSNQAIPAFNSHLKWDLQPSSMKSLFSTKEKSTNTTFLNKPSSPAELQLQDGVSGCNSDEHRYCCCNCQCHMSVPAFHVLLKC